jgi:endonuclease YncB( thermonuclease family)
MKDNTKSEGVTSIRRMLAMACALVALPAAAQVVTDGDTIKFGSQRVRLFGIDAPESGQACDDGAWRPGPLATAALKEFIGGRPVECLQVDYDRKNKRPDSSCTAGGEDLQALMVSAGWAWAYANFSDRYVDAERRSAARGAGVHAHRCQKPWEWRTHRRPGVRNMDGKAGAMQELLRVP